MPANLALLMTRVGAALPRLFAAAPDAVTKFAKSTGSKPTVAAAVKEAGKNKLTTAAALAYLGDSGYDLLTELITFEPSVEPFVKAIREAVDPVLREDDTERFDDELALITSASHIVRSYENLKLLRNALALSDEHFVMHESLTRQAKLL